MVLSVFGVLSWRVGRLQRYCVTMFAFVKFTMIVREHGRQIPVQRYVALVHDQAMCLRCVCVALKALLVWSGMAFQQHSISLGSPPFLRFLPSFPFFYYYFLFFIFFPRFGGLFILLPLGFWPPCDGCYSGGLGAGGGGWGARCQVAGWQASGCSSALGCNIIAVEAPWPMGTQPPLATQALIYENVLLVS